MKNKKGRPQYQGFSLPTPFVEEIKKHIGNDQRYRSITDFIRSAIREKMDIDIGAESLRKSRKQEYKERYNKAYFDKYGVTPEKDNRPGDFSFRGVNVPTGEPTIEELEVRLGNLERIVEMNKPKVKDKKIDKNNFRG